MKLSKLFAVLVVLSMLLTACGQAAPTTVAEEPAATDAPAAEVPAATEAPKTEPVNLTLSFWGSDLDTQVYQERVNMFMEKNPDIKVELLYIPSDYSQKVQTMIAGGTAPDVIQLSEDVHSYSSKGQVISLNDFVTNDGLDLKVRYGETGGLTTAYSMDGNLYAMPDRGGALILYYNKDMFDAAGVSYPTKDWTWVEFLDATQKLTVREGDTVTQYGFAAGGWWPWWMSFIYMNGGAVLDASGQPVVNSPWGIGGLKDATFNWDIAPLFKNKNNATVVFGSGLAISKDCKNPEAAWKLIEFLTSEEGQAPIIEFKQDAPANIANLSSDAFLNQSWSNKPINMSALGDSANAAFALPLSPKWNEMMSVFDTNLGEVFANRAEVKPTMDAIQEQLVDLFAQ